MPDAPVLHDFHVHTHLSDGFASPSEVVRAAAAAGLASLAITDHDCVDAHREPDALEVALAAGVDLVTGVEVDCHHEGEELEILGYRFDPHHPALVTRLDRVQGERRERFRFFCEGLARDGEPVDPDAVLGGATRVPIKVHLYRALAAAGRTFRGGYREYKARLEALGPAPSLHKPTLEEAVALVREAGGFAVLAHPLYFARRTPVPALLALAASAGCAGAELGYPYTFGEKGLPPTEVETGLVALREHLPKAFPKGYVVTAGSDTHDPAEWVERLALVSGVPLPTAATLATAG